MIPTPLIALGAAFVFTTLGAARRCDFGAWLGRTLTRGHCLHGRRLTFAGQSNDRNGAGSIGAGTRSELSSNRRHATNSSSASLSFFQTSELRLPLAANMLIIRLPARL